MEGKLSELMVQDRVPDLYRNEATDHVLKLAPHRATAMIAALDELGSTNTPKTHGRSWVRLVVRRVQRTLAF